MRYMHLDGLAVPVSKIALGSTYLGSAYDKSLTYEFLDTFAAAGGTVIDTARVYGEGASERVIGSWLAERGMRDKIVLVTKGLHNMSDGKSRYSAHNLANDIAQSQEALQSDAFDIWFLHRDDVRIPVEEIIDMVAPYVQSGTIRLLGASNWTPGRIEAANRYAHSRHLPPIVASEIQWSLARTDCDTWDDHGLVSMDDASLMWYRKTRMPVFAYSAQSKGYFSKAIAHGIDALPQKCRTRFHIPENAMKIERVRRLSDELKLPVAAITIAFVTSAQPPAVAIVTGSNVAQLQESLTGADVLLTAEQVTYLETGVYGAT